MNKLIAIDTKSGKPYKFTAPENFNELTEQQLVAWSAICLKSLKVEDLVRAIMVVFYRIPIGLFDKVPESHKAQLAPTLRFLFGKNTLTKWVIKELWVGGCGLWGFLSAKIKFYGPDDKLANITIAEFRATEMYYQAYELLSRKYQVGSSKTGGINKEAEKYLDLLIAALYRPKRSGVIDLDIREDLTEHGTMKRAERMRFLSRKVRHAILLNYEGVRLFIKENYLDKLPKGDAKKNDGLFDFNGIILSVAGSKFGTKAETEKALLYDFLNHLVISAEEMERLKRKK